MTGLDDKTALSSSLNSEQNFGGEISSQAPINPVPLREEIRAIDSIGQAGGESNSEKDIALLAKNFEPLCKRIVSVIDSTGIKIVSSVGKKYGWEEDDLDPVLDKVAMAEETKQLMTVSSARICARRIKNPEQLDWAALFGCFIEWGAGIKIAVSELKKHGPMPRPDFRQPKPVKSK
jgi:predicted NACHT family NTPase